MWMDVASQAFVAKASNQWTVMRFPRIQPQQPAPLRRTGIPMLPMPIIPIFLSYQLFSFVVATELMVGSFASFIYLAK